MSFLRSGQFWGGVIVGVLLVMFFPSLNLRGKMQAG